METVRTLDGKAGTTASMTSSNTAQLLTSTLRISSDGIRSNGAIISVESEAIRYAFNEDPTIAGLGHICMAGSGIVLNSPQMVNSFKFISAATSTPATLQITPII